MEDQDTTADEINIPHRTVEESNVQDSNTSTTEYLSRDELENLKIEFEMEDEDLTSVFVDTKMESWQSANEPETGTDDVSVIRLEIMELERKRKSDKKRIRKSQRRLAQSREEDVYESDSGMVESIPRDETNQRENNVKITVEKDKIVIDELQLQIYNADLSKCVQMEGILKYLDVAKGKDVVIEKMHLQIYSSEHCDGKSDNLSAIHAAAQSGNLSDLQSLIEGTENYNAVTSNSHTILHVAAKAGKLDVVKYLLDNGAEINYRNFKNKTPLMEASENDHMDVELLLLEHGAELYVPAESSWTSSKQARHLTENANDFDTKLLDTRGFKKEQIVDKLLELISNEKYFETELEEVVTAFEEMQKSLGFNRNRGHESSYGEGHTNTILDDSFLPTSQDSSSRVTFEEVGRRITHVLDNHIMARAVAERNTKIALLSFLTAPYLMYFLLSF